MRTNEGPGRVLIFVYGVFAVSATVRATYQIATKFDHAPFAYLLSAFAAAVYIVATVALARGNRTVALMACSVELVGVVTVGLVTAIEPGDFPDDTVWSLFGRGYGFVPLVLPILGLLWLLRTRKQQLRVDHGETEIKLEE